MTAISTNTGRCWLSGRGLRRKRTPSPARTTVVIAPRRVSPSRPLRKRARDAEALLSQVERGTDHALEGKLADPALYGPSRVAEAKAIQIRAGRDRPRGGGGGVGLDGGGGSFGGRERVTLPCPA